MRLWLALFLIVWLQVATWGQGRIIGVRPIATAATDASGRADRDTSIAIGRIVGIREIHSSQPSQQQTDNRPNQSSSGRIVGVREIPAARAEIQLATSPASAPKRSRITGVRPIVTTEPSDSTAARLWAQNNSAANSNHLAHELATAQTNEQYDAAKNKAAENESAKYDSAQYEPASSEPASSEPAPSEPAPSEPAPSEPAPSNPALADMRLTSSPAASLAQVGPSGEIVPAPEPAPATAPATAQPILPQDAVAESLQELQATRNAATSTSSDWNIKGGQSRLLPLIMAIQNSLTTKQVLHNLGSTVTVETTTLLDPDIAAQQVTIAQSRFDPNIESFIGSNHIDLPPSSFSVSGLPVQTKRDEMELITRLTKEWSTGAKTSIGYEPSLAYLFFPLGNRSGYNPINSSDLLVTASQPLMRGAGQTVNLATIRISEDRQDQTRLNVDAKLQEQLRGIEYAYWRLHASHVWRVAIAEAIALSDKMYEIEQSRFDAGRVIFADVARVGAKRENLIQQKLEAERAIQRLSLQISQMAGMSLEATTMLVPSDAPEYRLRNYDLNSMVAVAMNQNPNLQLQRREIEIRDTQLQVARNGLLPQLDLRSSVRSSGLNDDLGSALTDMARIEFVNFTVGMGYTRQIGNRAATSKYRQTQLEAARARQLLDAFEQNVAFNMAEALNSVELSYAKFESALRQLAQAQEWVKLANIRYENPPEELGQEALLVALMDYQYAIQARVDALVSTAEALSDYNTKLVDVELQQGTLLERWGIALAAPANQPTESSDLTTP